MAKNVIILGAGASAPFGAPVMSNFLDVAQSLLAGMTGNTAESFQNVFKAVSQLQAVHSKAEFDLVNLESIFTAFELAKILGRFPGRMPEEIDKLIEDLKRVIIVTLERTIAFATHSNYIAGHEPITSFIRSIMSSDDGTKPSFAVLTFNYDIIVDMACYRAGIGVDYGLAMEPNAHWRIPLLKLHGSLNWGVETESKRIVPWFLSNYFTHYSTGGRFGDSSVTIPIGMQIFQYSGYTDNHKQIDELPVIVPPSWNKADSHRSIAAVWSRAANELAEADSIFVIGYSLPPTDSFFRQLYALGTVGDTPLKRFFVYNIDPTREAVFKGLLGPGARSRYAFYPFDTERALQHVVSSVGRKWISE